MSTNITSDNGVELEVCSLGIAVVNHEDETETWARLSDAQRVELAAALDPGRRGLHVRLDNQAATLATYRCERDEALRKKGEAFDRAVRAERERDAAVARAEAHAKGATRANLDRDTAYEELAGMTRDRDEWKARAENLEREFAEFKGNANRLNVRAVDRDVVEAELVEGLYRGFTANQLMQRVCAAIDDDPAALIINVPAVTRDDIDRALINVTSNAMNYPTPSQMLGKDTGPLRKKCVDAMCDLFGVEAEQTVDPVEKKATEYLTVMFDYEDIDSASPADWEAATRMARHVLGREATR